jgi:hypothetical protein
MIKWIVIEGTMNGNQCHQTLYSDLFEYSAECYNKYKNPREDSNDRKHDSTDRINDEMIPCYQSTKHKAEIGMSIVVTDNI